MRSIFNLIATFILLLCGINKSLAQNWQLVWSDEFTNGVSSDWVFETGGGGWGNNELEYYQQSNATVQNGQLYLTAKQQSVGGMNYTSVRMKTQGKKSWTYGKIEASIAVPSFQGAWPAFWMLGDNISSVGWPACGEIDIMEHVNTGNTTYGTIHWDNGGHQQYSNNSQVNNIVTFHTYTVIWDANSINWLVDGVQYASANIANNINNTGAFHNNFFILLNFAIGGAWPGYTVDNGSLPSNMIVDYVRVYQDSPGPSPSTGLVTVYKDCNYSGFSGGLNVGDYTTAQLNALGVLNNDVSSLKVTEGYKVIAYDGDNFTGNSIVYTADNSCVGAWNDMISSIQVRTNGATNMSGTYYLQNRNSGLFMDVNGGVSATGDGVNISQWSATNTDNQKFQFVHLGDGTYEVLAAHSQKSIDISGGPSATQDGANVQQWTYLAGSNQQFVVVPVTGNYYKIIAKNSGKVVEVAGASTAVGGNVQQWTNNNQTCGQWNFNPVQLSYNAGTGIRGDYFNGMNFDTWKTTRTDANVAFDWGNGSPDASVSSDGYTARWSGKIQPRYSGTYTFYLNSDNGRRLWINNQLVVDKWIDDWGVEYTGTINLSAGQKYDIVLEYFENNGGASCKMEWSSPLQWREVVPQGQLYPNAAPTVSITAPANNATYVASASFTITANAADSDGSISKVDFYNGTTLLGTSTTSPYSFNWTNVAAGTYTITAVATDNQKVFATSSAITVKVNTNQNPTVSITAPANNATYTSPASVSITATASDVDGTVSKVDFYNGTTLLGSSTASPYSYNWTGVTAGTYTLTAKATDNKGGITTSTAITVVVKNPNQAPTVTITAPANNATYVASANVTITANANDSDGSISKVEFYNGTTLLGTVTASPFTYNWTNVGVGTYTITAKAYDNLSLATTSSAITVKVNANQNPTVSASATSPSANTVNISATATDGDGTITKVDYYDGTTKIGTSTSAPYTFTWTGASAGTHNITAVATDDKGGTTTSSVVSVTVSNGNQAPTVSITSPSNNATYVAAANISITATAADVDGSIAKVEFYNGATLLGSATTTPYTFNWSNVAAGTYSLTAKATDNLGLSKTSTAISLTVYVNQSPILTVNASSTAPNSVTISVNASDPDGAITKVEYFDGTTKIGESTSAPYNYTWANAPAGSHNIIVKVTDDKGGVTTSQPVSVNVADGNQAPSVTLTTNTSGNGGGNTGTSSVLLSATASDADGSIVKVEFFNGSTKLGEATSSPYTFLWNNVADGTYNVRAVATDNKGLTNEDQVSLNVQRATTGTQDFVLKSAINIYPNPTQDIINLSLEVDAVSIQDLSGRQLEYINLYGQQTIDLSKYNSGVYIIQIIKGQDRGYLKVTRE